jgi:hypothetical protein
MAAARRRWETGEEDDELFHRLETTHPNPYATRPKAEVDRERQRLSEALARPLTMVDFYKAVAPLVNSLGDRHTYIALPLKPTASSLKMNASFPSNYNGRRAAPMSLPTFQATLTFPLARNCWLLTAAR